MVSRPTIHELTIADLRLTEDDEDFADGVACVRKYWSQASQMTAESQEVMIQNHHQPWLRTQQLESETLVETSSLSHLVRERRRLGMASLPHPQRTLQEAFLAVFSGYQREKLPDGVERPHGRLSSSVPKHSPSNTI